MHRVAGHHHPHPTSSASTMLAMEDLEKNLPPQEGEAIAFTSKEATMAAVCRQVATQGLELIPDAFALKEW